MLGGGKNAQKFAHNLLWSGPNCIYLSKEQPALGELEAAAAAAIDMAAAAAAEDGGRLGEAAALVEAVEAAAAAAAEASSPEVTVAAVDEVDLLWLLLGPRPVFRLSLSRSHWR